MWKKLARYGLLSLCSFCLFSVLLHTAAYAQIPVMNVPDAEQTAQIPPTPSQEPTPAPTAIPQQSDNEKITLQTDAKITLWTDQKITLGSDTLPADLLQAMALSTDIPTETPIPTPTATPTLTQTQTAPAQQPVPGSLDADKLFGMVNSHRQAIGLAPYQKDEKTCNLAQVRAPEIAAEMAAGTLHSGMYGRNLPYWNTENAIALGSEEAAFNWWMNEPIHRAAIDSKTHTVSCVACSGIYCVEEFTSYISK